MKYDGYILYTDLDSTLIGKNGKISDDNISAIKYFQKNGGKFSYATGRSFDFIKKFSIEANAPLICANGTRIYDFETGNEICDFPMDENDKKALLYAKENYSKILAAYVFLKDGRVECSVSEAAELKGKIYKVVFVFENENEALTFQKDMINKFKMFSFERSWNVGVEMLSCNGGKGAAVRKVREIYKNAKIICVGDYENDISMIEEADVGVAVKNAVECVKNAADIIAPSCDESAIAWIIENIVN